MEPDVNIEEYKGHWPVIGSECIYIYKGPWGYAWTPERFKAKVLGFTKKGMVRIEAFDGKEWFKATVWRRSIARPSVGELYRRADHSIKK